MKILGYHFVSKKFIFLITFLEFEFNLRKNIEFVNFL